MNMAEDATRTGYLAAWGAFEGADGVDETEGLALIPNAYVEVDEAGTIVRLASGLPPEEQREGVVVHELGARLLLPGFVNAHSHAFQRGIRGRANRGKQGNNGLPDPDDFWSWRHAMYGEAGSLCPDTLHAVTRACFDEMVSAGITCVGEFHYVHHQSDGTPYDDPNELSWQVIEAARLSGIRLVLLEVYYARAGAGLGLRPEQRRFRDASVDAYRARLDALRSRIERDPGDVLRLGMAPHSIRAVSLPELRELADYAATHALVVHAHVSEQPAENEACRAELGWSPTAAFAEAGLLSRPDSFTAVHAIHIDDDDRRRLAHQHVCACPTTEADLGDGTIVGSALRDAHVTLALGSDSNVVIDLVQEARALEMHERLARQRRLCLADARGRLGLPLLEAATRGGARALGRPELGRLAVGSPFDAAALDLGHRMFAGADSGDVVLDTLMLHGTAEAVDRVWVGGKRLR
jgi:formimidoylglutamate deiminase